MMAFFNGSKRPRILLVTILILTLIAAYAVPMTVFAEALNEENQQIFDLSDPELAEPAGDNNGGGDGVDLNQNPMDDEDGTATDDDADSSDDATSGDDTQDTSSGGIQVDADAATSGAIQGDEPDGTSPGTSDEEGTTDGTTDEGLTGEGEFLDGELLPGMMTLMKAPVVTIPSTGDNIKPGLFEQNKQPDDLNNYAKYKISGKKNQKYIDKKTGLEVTLKYNDKSKTVVDWTSNYPVKYVVVKGQGNDQEPEKGHINLYEYPGSGDTGDNGLMAPLHNNDYSKINYVVFYFAVPQKDYDISLEKTVSKEEVSPGETVTYTFVVTNTGTETLDKVLLTDKMFGWKEDLGAMNGGETRIVTKTYTVPDEPYIPVNYDIKNVATVSGEYTVQKDNGKPEVKSIKSKDKATMTVIARKPFDINLEKTVSTDEAVPGDVVTYTFTIKNTGQFALKDIVLTDSKLGPDWKEEISRLEKDETATFTANHQIPADAVVDSEYVNEATVIGKKDGASILPDSVDFDFLRYILEWLIQTSVSDTDTASLTVVDTTDPEDPTVYQYKVTYLLEGTDEVLDIINGTTSAITANVSINDSLLDRYELVDPEDQTVGFNFETENPNEGVYEKEVYLTYRTFDYTVNFLATPSGITVAAVITGETTQSSIQLTLPAVSGYKLASKQPKYPIYDEESEEYQTEINNGVLTITLYKEYEGYITRLEYNEFDVYYVEDKTTPDKPSRPNRDTSTTIVDEETPAAPIPTDEAIILEDEIIMDEQVPAGALPKTGGVPSMLLYGIGALLAGSGLVLRKKK